MVMHKFCHRSRPLCFISYSGIVQLPACDSHDYAYKTNTSDSRLFGRPSSICVAQFLAFALASCTGTGSMSVAMDYFNFTFPPPPSLPP